jgi:glycine oxidase
MQALEPGLAPRFSSGLHIGNEAHLDPRQALARLCATILQKGGTFVQRAAEPQDLADRYNRIIDCRGMGARHADPDLRGVKGEMVVVRNRDFTLRRPVRLMHPRYPLYIVPRADHVFMIGATVIEADDDNRQVSVRAALELLSAAYSLHPGFGEAKIIDIMAGIRPAYADNLPRIKQEGKIISANGLFRHGFLLAPVMARAICDCIEGRENRFISLFTGGHDDRHPQRSKEENRHAA